MLMTLGAAQIAVLARRHRLDLVHDPVGICPFPFGKRVAPFRRVVTIHDAIAYQYPEGYPWLNTFLQRRYVPAMLPQVDAVITVSAHARKELERFLPALGDRLDVVPDAVAEGFRPVAAPQRRLVLERLGLQRPYILSVGAQQERKNLRPLIQAFARLHARFPAYQLVLAGPTLWHFPPMREQIEQAGLVDSVVMLGYVPEADLATLYSGAAVYVFPSLYEGFGIPVLEAMACGTPVVCSNTTSLPEVAGDGALLVDPTSATAVAAGIERVLGDGTVAAELRRRGLERAAGYTWPRVAEQTVAVYRRVMQSAPPGTRD